MDIYLRVESGDTHLADLEVRVEQSHTVRDVADAVVDFLGYNARSDLQLSRAGTGPLNENLTMAEAGLLSGDTLVLGRHLPPRPHVGGERVLAVASGPDVGASVVLQPGRYSVGRSAGCDLVLSDPQVSREHLLLHVDFDDQVMVEVVAQERNEVRTEGHTLVDPEPVQPGQVLRVGASTLVVREQPSLQATRVDAFGQVPFHRTPYFPAPVQEVVVEGMKDIPVEPEKARFAYLSAILPVLMGISMFFFFGSVRFLFFIALSPIMVIGNYFEQRRRTGRKFSESIRRFNEALLAKTAEVRAVITAERQRRFQASPDVADLRTRASKRSIDLWVRDRNAYDFLALRAGVGDLPATFEVKTTDQGDIEFRDQIDEALGEIEIVSDVPVALNLSELGVVGLIGRAAETSALAASMAVQATCLHSPEDLVLFGALSPARGLHEWLKWSPHTRSSSSPLAGSHLAETKQAADALISELIREAARRSEAGETARFPWLLAFIDRALEPDGALVSRLLDTCPQSGMSVVWLTDTRERVPRQSRAIIDCQSPVTGQMSRISFTDPDVADIEIDLDRVTAEFAGSTARSLAPLRDASSANAATAIPRTVPLFTAFGIEAIDSDWIAAQWKTDRGYSLQGPIGYTDAGPLVLDIVEHGPHGLIGGTSGAGKSELVMSMVASLIAFNPPSKVNFLFIDYKGGASSDLFKDVPHTVGYVTNLDGLLSMRALTSLRAELNRRMNLMQGKAKDLAEMIERHPDEAPPSLVIVVDEFATLVKEIPDFVAGIVDIAQRGRSLGIHLMLATQRPSGSVNDNIKANTNLRISLRMLDGAESSAVIGSQDAAHIPAPLKGRGYARMGPGDLVAFQSAWAGAPLLAASGVPPVGVRPFGRTPLPPSAGRPLLQQYAPGPTPVDEAPVQTQVDALLDAVVEATNRLGYKQGRPPWLEVLPTTISIEELFERAQADGVPLEPGSKIVFGMVDDPASQAQFPAVVDMARSGGIMVHGTGGSGKSTMLKTLAISAALADSASGGGHLTIFGLDFASRELGALNRLPQCGGVAASDDLEAVTRIISLLTQEFERRRQALAEAVAKAEAPPQETTILLLIDGAETITELMEHAPSTAGLARFAGLLWSLVVDGRQVGIYPAIAAARRGGFKANVTSAISDRVILRQAEPQGYAEAGIGSADAKTISLDPGQAFYNGPDMMQVAKLVAEGDGGVDEVEQERAERAHLVELADRLAGQVDPRLRTEALPRSLGLLPSTEPLRPVIGVADLTNRPYVLDLSYNNVSVYGDPRSGRSTALAAIGAQVAGAGGEVWIMAPPGSALRQLDVGDRVCFAEGEERAEFVQWMAEAVDTPSTGSRVLLFDDYDQFPDSDRDIAPVLAKVLAGVRWAISGPKPRGYNSSSLAQDVRKARSIVLLRPNDGREAHETLDVPVDWHPGLPMVEGRGYVSVDRLPTMIQFSSPFQE